MELTFFQVNNHQMNLQAMDGLRRIKWIIGRSD